MRQRFHQRGGATFPLQARLAARRCGAFALDGSNGVRCVRAKVGTRGGALSSNVIKCSSSAGDSSSAILKKSSRKQGSEKMILRTELRVLRVLVGCEELLLWGVGRHASYSFKMGDALGEETFEAIVCDNSSAADPLAVNFARANHALYSGLRNSEQLCRIPHGHAQGAWRRSRRQTFENSTKLGSHVSSSR